MISGRTMVVEFKNGNDIEWSRDRVGSNVVMKGEGLRGLGLRVRVKE